MYECSDIKQGCFTNPESYKLFAFDVIPDRIVFYLIFMPLIRHEINEINEFVLTWNAYRIRSQKTARIVWQEFPIRLYFHPPQGIEKWGRMPNPEELERQTRKFGNFGMSFSQYPILSTSIRFWTFTILSTNILHWIKSFLRLDCVVHSMAIYFGNET